MSMQKAEVTGYLPIEKPGKILCCGTDAPCVELNSAEVVRGDGAPMLQGGIFRRTVGFASSAVCERWLACAKLADNRDCLRIMELELTAMDTGEIAVHAASAYYKWDRPEDEAMTATKANELITLMGTEGLCERDGECGYGVKNLCFAFPGPADEEASEEQLSEASEDIETLRAKHRQQLAEQADEIASLRAQLEQMKSALAEANATIGTLRTDAEEANATMGTSRTDAEAKQKHEALGAASGGRAEFKARQVAHERGKDAHSHHESQRLSSARKQVETLQALRIVHEGKIESLKTLLSDSAEEEANGLRALRASLDAVSEEHQEELEALTAAHEGEIARLKDSHAHH